jgi:hypothetical protein
MYAMQTFLYDCDLSAFGTASATAPWILEGPDRVDIRNGRLRIYNDGNCVARSVGPHRMEKFSCDELQYREFKFPHLYLSRSGALGLMRGKTIVETLGPAAVLVGFRSRPVWDPMPGFDDVRLVVPYANPENLTPTEVLQRVVLSKNY